MLKKNGTDNDRKNLKRDSTHNLGYGVSIFTTYHQRY